MNNYKVGDKVRICNDLSKTIKTCGCGGEEMHDMKGNTYTISKVCNKFIDICGFDFHPDDLALVPKIQEVIDGAKLWDLEGCIDNGRFIGYTIEFDSEDEDGFPCSVYYVVDENLKASRVMNSAYKCSPLSAPFEIQPKKTKMHDVVYRVWISVTGKGSWVLVTLSDEALEKTKRDWAEYKIIETWFE